MSEVLRVFAVVAALIVLTACYVIAVPVAIVVSSIGASVGLCSVEHRSGTRVVRCGSWLTLEYADPQASTHPAR